MKAVYNKNIYNTKTVKEFATDRSEVFLGSSNKETNAVYIYDEESDKIILKDIIEIPSYKKIIDEVLNNAVDNILRSITKEYDNLFIDMKIEVDKKDNNYIYHIKNGGIMIPIEKDDKTNKYIPEIIFGDLLSGSNYNDTEERYCTGINGVGAKMTNINSNLFEIEINDINQKQKYLQTWSKCGERVTEPKITTTTHKTPYVSVKFKINNKRFNIDLDKEDDINMLKDNIYYYHKRMIDIKATLNNNCDISFNKHKIKINNFKTYCSKYDFNDEGSSGLSLFKQHNYIDDVLNYETSIYITYSLNKTGKVVSFVNCMNTNDNGKHVDVWINEIIPKLCDKLLTKSNKELKLKSDVVKKYLNIVISSYIKNPLFDSQTKSKLIGSHIIKNTKNPLINIKDKEATEIIEYFISKLSSCSVIKGYIKDYIESLNEDNTKKTIETNKKKKDIIENYDRANKSGTNMSKYCTLAITEGLSAKTFAVTAIDSYCKIIKKLNLDAEFQNIVTKNKNSIKGRDWLGIFPLKGVPLNSRTSNNNKIYNNDEIMHLMQILNIDPQLDYTKEINYNKLYYGRLLILTDEDIDGKKITGLIMNIFHNLFPSLLNREFIYTMHTPVLSIKIKQNVTVLFYEEQLAISYILKYSTDSKVINYYKGLGSSTKDIIYNCFGESLVKYNKDDKTDAVMTKIYGKEHSDIRKDYIKNFTEDVYDNEVLQNISNCIKTLKSNEKYIHVMTDKLNDECSYSSYLENDVIQFSVENCKRCISHLMDGLKPSQRKVLYTVFVTNKDNYKVAQLAGTVAAQTNYHHGENNLNETIIKMAQDFIGSNNIPLLYPNGSFGSRLANGKDAASPRYIHTYLQKYTRYIFIKDDDAILEKLIEDGDEVEPKYYLPIIPMVLINGIIGIATGFSSKILSFNVKQIIEYIKYWLNNNKFNDDINIDPWYKNYKGNIKKISDNKWEMCGIYEYNKKNKIITITEIPITISFNDFVMILEKLKNQKKITKYENYTTDVYVKYLVYVDLNDDKEVLNLISSLKTSLDNSNITLYDSSNNLKKYNDIFKVLKEYCTFRLTKYVSRKTYLLNKLIKELIILNNKYRFIKAFIENNDIVTKQTKENIIKYLKEHKYDKIDDDDNYNYLLTISIISMSKDMSSKLEKQVEEKNKDIDILNKITINKMWLNDLNELEKVLYND